MASLTLDTTFAQGREGRGTVWAHLGHIWGARGGTGGDGLPAVGNESVAADGLSE